MRILRQSAGIHNGQPLELVTLQNNKGTIVKVTNLGGIITSIIFQDKNNQPWDIVLGFDKVEDYLSETYLRSYPYFGAVIGRYANRIKNGRFQLDGVDYQIAQNNGQDCLHGGIEGFDRKVWKIVETTEGSMASVKLRYTSPDGEENFPGNLTVDLTIGLTDENTISIEFEAVTDKTTIVNLTHHGYFNLNGGEGPIGDHLLRLNASNYLEQDANYVVNGSLINVKDTSYDFTTQRPINLNWNPDEGYDQTFVIDKNGTDLNFAAYAKSEQTGIIFEVLTTNPVVHLYCGKYISPMLGKSNKHYGPFSAFCLETQVHPNAINIPWFPNTILRPGEKAGSKTIYKLSNASN